MKILLTAFDPFGEDKVNPALEAVKLVKIDDLDAEVIKLEVPTVFHKSINIVQEKIKAEKPDAVLAIGQAGGRPNLTVERVAINQDDARIKDNEGNQPIGEAIFSDGKNAYFATLPIKAMVKKIQEAGLPANISNSAGTFVCNHLMYGILYTLEKNFPNARGGFMHVPYIPEQVIGKTTQPSMSIEAIAKGIHAALQAIIENACDIKQTGGAIS